MIQSIIGTSFTGGGYNPPPVTFVASNYNPIEGTTITFTISGITGVSEGTTLYWWIDGTSGQFSRADQFVENKDNDTLQLSLEKDGTLSGTFTLTPNQGDIDFNIYIGYSLYGGFLNLPSDVVVIENITFDVTANWSLTTPPVVDEESFRTFLESGGDGDGSPSSLTDVVITNFSLVNGRLICNLSATGTILYLNNIQISDIVSFGNIIGLQQLRLLDNQIVTFDTTIALPNSLQTLYLNSNQIVTFDPTIALPSSLINLDLTGNQIVTFDPSIALPSSLQNLYLGNNQIVTFDPSIALPNSLQGLLLFGNQIVTFDPTIALPSGLQQLYLNNNDIVTFDPSIALPNSLQELYLDNNQMTTAGYTASETWANAMSVIPNRGTIDFNNNINGVIDTNLESILVSKGWTVEGDPAQLPFDVTANWSLTTPPVTNEASFITFLESGEDGDGNTNSQTGVVVTDFLLEGNRLRCNLSSTGGNDLGFALMGVTDATSFGNLQMNGTLYLYSNNILSVDNTSWPIGVTSIDVSNNSITSFDNVTWPSGLQNLYLNSNQIVTFDPTIALPTGLQNLSLDNNQIVTFDPTIPLPSGLQTFYINNNQIVTFNPNIPLPDSLVNLILNNNQIVTFNPNIPLPDSLVNLNLNNNQMTTAGYTASESWANSMSVIPGRGTVQFNNNVDGVISTNLESILVSKGWTVQGDPAQLPFDVTANWGLTTPEVVDEASFITFLESGEDGGGSTNSLTDVVITDFSLVNGRLICNLSATGTILYLNNIQISDIVSFGNIIGLQQLRLNNNQIVTFDPTITLPNSLWYLFLDNNQIVTFDPSIALPNSLQVLVLSNNQIVTFNPTLPLYGLQSLILVNNQIVTFDPTVLPTGLQQLYLGGNYIVTFDPTQALPNLLQDLRLDGNQIVTFDPSIALPSGLQRLYLYGNDIVTFDPSIALPNSLQYLYLNGNQMTTAGYTASESWASSMSVIPGRGTIDFNDNVDGVISTNLESILVSKGWTVEGDPNLLPFDVTANWSLTTPAVTDEASFRTFLETGRDPSNNYNYLTNLVITGFSITTVSGVQKRIQCNLYATSTSSTYNLRALQITQINALGNIPIKTSLNLISNQIPSIVTLSSTSIFNNLQVLTVDSNQLGSTFNSINWPPNLTQLSAKNNNTLSFNPTNPLPNSMSSLSITGNGITGANMNYTKLPTGLTFLNITTNPLGGNFNPSVPLPNGIHTLYLEQCQLTSLNPTFSLPSSLISFYASNNFITSIDVSKLPNTLQNLFLSSNSLTSAINNHVWPSSLRYLNLNFNPTIGTFNPVNPLPSLLNELGLQQTGISSFNPTLALPSTLKILNVSQNPITSFNPTLALPSGLLTLYLSQTQIVSFNPTNPLPSSITTLWFNSSQMTTAGYTASEPWANAMSVIPGRGNVQFTGNINSVSGTNLQTILISKGWTVTV